MLPFNEVFGLSFTGSSLVSSDSDATRRNAPGQLCYVEAREGRRVYRYTKVKAAFAIGQIAMVSAPNQTITDITQAQATTTNLFKKTGGFTANQYNDGTFPSGYVTTNTGTGNGQTRSVRSNSADILTVDRNWDVALDTTTDGLVYDPNYVSLANTGSVSVRASNVFGVAISAVTIENWSWFQVGGFCPLVRCVGSTDPAIRGAIIVPSATAGACKGPTAGGTTADEAGVAFGIAFNDWASGDSAGVGIAANLNCRYMY